MSSEPRNWQVIGASGEAKAFIEAILTPDVMESISEQAGHEAADRLLWGDQEIGPFETELTPEGEEFLARLADSVRGRK
jgi:hypothetical protein